MPWNELYVKSAYYQAEHTRDFWPNDYATLAQDDDGDVDDEADNLTEITQHPNTNPAL